MSQIQYTEDQGLFLKHTVNQYQLIKDGFRGKITDAEIAVAASLGYTASIRSFGLGGEVLVVDLPRVRPDEAERRVSELRDILQQRFASHWEFRKSNCCDACGGRYVQMVETFPVWLHTYRKCSLKLGYGLPSPIKLTPDPAQRFAATFDLPTGTTPQLASDSTSEKWIYSIEVGFLTPDKDHAVELEYILQELSVVAGAVYGESGGSSTRLQGSKPARSSKHVKVGFMQPEKLDRREVVDFDKALHLGNSTQIELALHFPANFDLDSLEGYDALWLGEMQVKSLVQTKLC